jgi:phosphoribosylanthranilate isomerase
MFVKICGLTEATALEAAVEAGADAVGFVFAESVREIAPARARELCRSLPEGVLKVAVMRHPSRDRYLEVLEVFEPDWVQTDAGDFAKLPEPSPALALPVFRETETRDLVEFPGRLVFEGAVSGSGTTADWNEAARIAGLSELILAGGLDVDNVADAVASVGPFGVDVSSGVERERGRKDPSRIREFVARVRALETDDD